MLMIGLPRITAPFISRSRRVTARSCRLRLSASECTPALPGGDRRQAELPADADYLAAPAIYAATM
jgi:hypothetical protein